jgi:hypothetical protein
VLAPQGILFYVSGDHETAIIPPMLAFLFLSARFVQLPEMKRCVFKEDVWVITDMSI